jgi:hypothetical protein
MKNGGKDLPTDWGLLDDPEWVAAVLARREQQIADPVSFSSLGYWLKLETWTRNEGLLILAGVDPQSIRADDDPLGFTERHLWEFDTAQPFTEPPDFTLEPFGRTSRKDYPGDDEGYKSLVQAQRRTNAILRGYRNMVRTLYHVLDRSIAGLGDPRGRSASRENLYGPDQFLAWARSIDYAPPWLDWAQQKSLLPTDAGPFCAPFFDADAPDYPELLAIAVRAWEHARKGSKGTPKQRVLDYLNTAYPSMPQGSRDAIAQVVNWHRTGGRPAIKAKKGG